MDDEEDGMAPIESSRTTTLCELRASVFQDSEVAVAWVSGTTLPLH